MNEELANVPDIRRLFKQLQFNNMTIFQCDQRDKKEQWAEETAVRIERLVIYV